MIPTNQSLYRGSVKLAALTVKKKFLPAPPPRIAARTSTPKTGPGNAPKSAEISNDIDNLFIGRRRSRTGTRRFALGQIHILLFTIIHAVFSLYMRIRQAYHEVRNQIYSVLKYHHRTPEIIARDVRDLSRIPKHLSVILRLEEHGREGAELERLVNEISDIAAWCASAGIPTLSVYEKKGKFESLLAWRCISRYRTHTNAHRCSQKLSSRDAPRCLTTSCFIFRTCTPSRDASGTPRASHRIGSFTPCSRIW